MEWGVTARLLVAAALLASGFGAGWASNGWRLGEDIATYRKELAEDAAKQTTAAQEKAQKRQDALDALDARYTEELSNANAEIDRLADDVAAGRRRLRLQANCPDMPSAGRAPRVDDGASPRLTDAAERDYWRLRERIETATQQVAGLQAYIRTQCLSP